jgi:hypothetical protein
LGARAAAVRIPLREAMNVRGLFFVRK